MKKTYCILCLICMFAATSVGISFAENEASKSQVTEEQFQALLRKAQAGDPSAQALVGNLYMRGEGCVQDDVKGILWLTKAAQQGHAQAQEMVDILEKYTSPIVAMRLASIYMQGTGVPQNYSLGVRWVRRAAELGLADGQVVLGQMYLGGVGVNKDLVRAHMWCNVAASRTTGPEKQQAIWCREESEKQMTVEQVREAQEMAATWKLKSVGK